MTFHRIGKNQAAMNVMVTTTCGGAWKPATLPQWIELGLKNGRKMITVSGRIGSTPSPVANAAPSRTPKQEGRGIQSSNAKEERRVGMRRGGARARADASAW